MGRQFHDLSSVFQIKTFMKVNTQAKWKGMQLVACILNIWLLLHLPSNVDVELATRPSSSLKQRASFQVC